MTASSVSSDARAEGAGDAAAVRLWWVPLDLGLATSLRGLLTDGELGRADAYRRPDDRARSILGAAVLRLAVAAETGASPRDVPLDRTCATCGGPHGRPTTTGTHLSLSHAGAWVVAATCRTAPVGVDVEPLADAVLDLRDAVVAPGDDPALPPETAAGLLDLWCAKEAFVKATGDGLAVDLREVVVASGRARRGSVLAALRPLVDRADHTGCVAVLGASSVVVWSAEVATVLRTAAAAPHAPASGPAAPAWRET